MSTPRSGGQQNPKPKGSRPRPAFIALGFLVFCGGCVISLVNYSDNATLLYIGIGLLALGVGIAWFSPSRRRNGPLNGNRGRG